MFIKIMLFGLLITVATCSEAQICLYPQDTTKVFMVVADTSAMWYSFGDESTYRQYHVFGLMGYAISYKKAGIPPIQKQNGRDVIVGEAWFIYVRYFHEDFKELNSNWFVVQSLKR